MSDFSMTQVMLNYIKLLEEKLKTQEQFANKKIAELEEKLKTQEQLAKQEIAKLQKELETTRFEATNDHNQIEYLYELLANRR